MGERTRGSFTAWFWTLSSQCVETLSVSATSQSSLQITDYAITLVIFVAFVNQR